MKAPTLEQTAAAKAGWLIILLVAGWLAYLLIPDTTKQPAANPTATPLPPSSLSQAGLRDYTDWDGLPEIFAIWADRAQWMDGKTRFAYWHPVMKDYSYYFEVVRVDGGFRFKEIAEPNEPGHYWDENLGEECPIRFYWALPTELRVHLPPIPVHSNPDPDPEGFKVDIAAPKIPVPVVKTIPLNPAPKP